MKNSRWSVISGVGLLMLVAYLPNATGQDAAQDRAQFSPERTRTAPAEREGGIPRSQVVEEAGNDQQGSEEGMPQTRVAPDGGRVQPQWLPPDRQRWKLGVHAYNTDTGVVVTRVVPGSPASRAGIERGDRVVAVSGFQVGWIDDRLYPLGAELQRQAGRRGEVTLLMQNVRNRRLLNLDVKLQGRGVTW
ncbi:PDZ domain-containing protein [Roseimaritima ulvae]|uniref:PDZ domain (Also known as DHR or GLGF) n=1 Tax=Roseimaritima ulvae TaxID=980254 RepID=A0A5B9QR30_9BACT|nr:PDZ domain-containing protein [Roseimaritima ulvae]QEG41478.1 PDZ domain (Also known as DHR or GLGF) [Roseimaritima ulvae]